MIKLYLSNVNKSLDLMKADPPPTGGGGTPPAGGGAPAAPKTPGAATAGSGPQIVDCPLGAACPDGGKHKMGSQTLQEHTQQAQQQKQTGVKPGDESKGEDPGKAGVLPGTANIGSVGSDNIKKPTSEQSSIAGKIQQTLEAGDKKEATDQVARLRGQVAHPGAEEAATREMPVMAKPQGGAARRLPPPLHAGEGEAGYTPVGSGELYGEEPEYSPVETGEFHTETVEPGTEKPKGHPDFSAKEFEQDPHGAKTRSLFQGNVPDQPGVNQPVTPPKKMGEEVAGAQKIRPGAERQEFANPLDPNVAPADSKPMDHYKLAQVARESGDENLAQAQEKLAQQRMEGKGPEDHKKLADELHASGMPEQAKFHAAQADTDTAHANKLENVHKEAKAKASKDFEDAKKIHEETKAKAEALKASNAEKLKGYESAKAEHEKAKAAAAEVADKEISEKTSAHDEARQQLDTTKKKLQDIQRGKTDDVAQAVQAHEAAKDTHEKTKAALDSLKNKHQEAKTALASKHNEELMAKQAEHDTAKQKLTDAQKKAQDSKKAAVDKATKSHEEAKSAHEEAKQKLAAAKNKAQSAKRGDNPEAAERANKEFEAAKSAHDETKKKLADAQKHVQDTKKVNTPEDTAHSEAQAAYDKIKGDLDSLRNTHQKSKSDLDAQHTSELSAKKAEHDEAKNKLADAAKTAQTTKTKAVASATEEHEKAKSAYDKVKADLDGLKAKHKKAQADLGNGPEKPKLESEPKTDDKPALASPESDAEKLQHGEHTERAKRLSDIAESHLKNNKNLSESDRKRLEQAHKMAAYHSNIDYTPTAAHKKELSDVERTMGSVGAKEHHDQITAREQAEQQAAQQKQQAAQQKQQAKQAAAQPKAPESDLDHAKVSAHKAKAQDLRNNIQAHMDSNPDMSDDERTKNEHILSELDKHENMDMVPGTDHESELKELGKLAGEHGKPPKEAKGSVAGEGSSMDRGHNYAYNMLHQGRALGAQLAASATSPEGQAGQVGTSVINYGVSGATSAGHHLLRGDETPSGNPTKQQDTKPQQSSLQERE